MATTGATVWKFLESPEWTASEKAVIKWQYNETMHLYGSFFTALWQAIVRADHENLARLERGFPEEIAGFRAWAYGDLAERFRAAGLDI